MFTDASKHSWSLVVSPYDEVRESIDLDNFVPKPLLFLSGKFNKTQVKWHISQKELYPIVYAHNRLSWLLLGHPGPIYVYTDHANLRNVLHPHKTAKTQHLERLRRWALLFQNVTMVFYHIPAEKNFFADLFTRWGAPSPDALSPADDNLPPRLRSSRSAR